MGHRPHCNAREGSSCRTPRSRMVCSQWPGCAAIAASHNDVEDYRRARGLTVLVGFYARSLSILDS